MTRIVAGVDVGLSSAAAAVYGYAEGRNWPRLISTTKIRTIGDAGGKRIDVLWFHNWLVQSGATIAYVENATAMPAPGPGARRQMGMGTMARYLRACGAIETCVTLAGLHGVLVMPSVWKRALGLLKADKKQSVILARNLFPEHAETTFKYWASHNIAEASLLALYAAARTDLVTLKAAA